MNAHFRQTAKAYVGAIVAGLGAIATAAVTGEPADAEAVEGLRVGVMEIGGAAVTALLAWAGVWKVTNQ